MGNTMDMTEKNKATKFKRTLLSSMVALYCLNGFAAEEAVQGDSTQSDEFEIIEVTSGFKQNLESAIFDKKASDEIGDSISADDIGSLPALDMGEALQAVPGVQLNREGSRRESSVNLRGLPSGFVLTTANNQAIATPTRNSSSSAFGPGNPFGAYDPSVFSGLKVVKSLSADMIEGGIAGTIDQGLKGALSKKDSFVTQIGARYEELADETDLEGVISGTKHLIEDTLAITATLAYSDQSFRRDAIRINAYDTISEQQFDQGNNTGSFAEYKAANNLPNNAILQMPGEYRQQSETNSGDRISFSGGIEYQATEDLKLGFNTIITKRELSGARLEQLEMRLDQKTVGITPKDEFKPRDTGQTGTSGEPIYVLSGVDFNNIRYYFDNRGEAQKEQAQAYIFDAEYTLGMWKFDGALTLSSAENEWSQVLISSRIDSPSGVDGSIYTGEGNIENFYMDLTGTENSMDWDGATWVPKMQVANTAVTSTTGANGLYMLLTGNYEKIEHQNDSFEINAERDFDDSFIKSIRFGYRYAETTLDSAYAKGSPVGVDPTGILTSDAMIDPSYVNEHAFFGGDAPGFVTAANGWRSFDFDSVNNALLSTIDINQIAPSADGEEPVLSPTGYVTRGGRQADGYAGGESPRPEETYLSSSTLRNCNSDYGLDGGSSCSFKDSNAAANGGDAIDGDYYFISNAFTYRQMESVEDDDAVIAAVQWKPTDKLDINFDAQWSESSYFEDRHDLSFDDARRRVSNWQTNDDHILTSYTGESRIANMNEMRTRDEEYKGAGFNVKWQVTDDLELAFDAAYSGTNRWQDRTYTRFRSTRKFYDWQQRSSQQFPDVTNVYTDFDDAAGSSINWQSDVNDLAFFDDDSEARKYRFEIDDRIRSTKLDAKYLLDAGMFTFLSSGFAYSSRSHQNYGEDQVSKATAKDDRAGVLASAASCLESWPQSGYGEDGDSPVSQWAYLDTACAYSTLVGSDVLSPDPKAPSEGDIDLTEEITSFYVMSDFESELAGMYVRGNVGVRYVHTNIESTGVTQSYAVQTDENGFIELDGKGAVEINHFENSFSNVLPSLNVILELREDTELRFAAFKAISRPDMWFYGAGREVSDITYDDGYTTPEQALDDGNVSARGNPNLELIKSNNYELGLNWYWEDETMLSASYYYKTFSARFGADTSDEQITVDGKSYETTVQGVPTIYDDESSIQGVEFTAVHRFKTLPEPFDGLGLSLSYNYSDSDYITPEAGGSITEDARAEVTPANLAGLSEHVANTQVYWEGEAASIRLSYKYRSDYLKPFGNDLSQTNRFVDDQKTVDLSLGYKLTEQLTAKFEVLNLTNEPAVQQRVAQGAYNQIEYSGSKVFFGIKYKM